MTDTNNVAAIVGVGPGLGLSVAERFAREDYEVVLLARSGDELVEYRDALRESGHEAYAVTVDAADPSSVDAAFEEVRQVAGPPEVLVYNAGAFRMGGILELDDETFEHCWKVNCHGGFLCAKRVLPEMVERESGTIIFTGATASLRGSANFAGLAVGKFGLRALAQSMAREFGPRGVHVAHAVIDGQIDTPQNVQRQPDRAADSFLSSDAIADEYWRLHTQDKTAWTLELDLRPYVEEF